MKTFDNLITDYRYERKIPLYSRSLPGVASKLLSLNFFEQHSNRKISSIYYDTQDLLSFKQNIDGIFEREKYRIRFYDDLSLYSSLEIKVKRGPLVGKYVQPLNLSVPLLDANLESASNYFLNYTVKKLYPIILIKYKRRYFVNKFGIRCTIDTHIESSRIINRGLLPSMPNSYEVLEFKYPLHLDDYFRENLIPTFVKEGYRFGKSSKYVRGINQCL